MEDHISNDSKTERLKVKSVPEELSPPELYHAIDPASLGFETTADLNQLDEVIGQPRAISALELGSDVEGPGYNIFVLGAPESGRTTLSEEFLKRKAASEATPDDWCYVHNFDNHREPRALRLPAGRGEQLRKDMQHLIQLVQREIPRVFESEEYARERDRLVADIKKNADDEFARLQEFVGQHNFALMRTSFGMVLSPLVDGRPLKPEELEQLSPEQRGELEQLQAKLTEEVERSLGKFRESERKANDLITELNSRTVLYLLAPYLRGLRDKYQEQKAVLDYLNAVQNDISANPSLFLPSEKESSAIEKFLPGGGTSWARRYEVNVVVDNSNLQGAPVIVETQPTYQNLLGAIEHEVMIGAARTDQMGIRAGAFHQANGGYLILSARDVLVNPYAWEGLKRVLRDGCIRILEMTNQLGLVSTVSLQPEPIPLDVKVVLVGTPVLYYMLRSYDEDFLKLFKVRAEFTSVMDRDQESEREYGMFVKLVLEQNNLPPFDNRAVAKIIEYSSRLAGDQEKLSTRFGIISDVIRESAHWTRKAGKEIVTAESVQKAIDERIYRSNLLEEHIQEMIDQGTLILDLEGTSVGQINALSVLSLGDYAFGKPSRLTATVHPGQEGVVDIERQANLGGRIHTKGVLIINGLLGQRYGLDRPLSLTARLTFEQSYEEVEGDSASAAEMIALLSAIAEVPLRQDRAITGSINQRGQIQPIGGANEKIEGFFTACKTRGLTGEQGVLIPAGNKRHLMLRADVVEAVSQGKFHIWPISTLEDGIMLLTGLEPGTPDQEGNYPEGSFNRLVNERLAAFAQTVQRFSFKPRPNGKEDESTKD